MSGISVVVPVRNGGGLFLHLCRALERARDLHDLDIIILDSGSSDGTPEEAERSGFRTHRIPPAEFGHGRTRNLGVRLARGEVVCFLTHDVLPCTPDWPVRFAEAFADPAVAGVYGRQVPRDASTMEMFFVALNYPQRPLRFDPGPRPHHPRPGRVLFSNAFSAVRRQTALRIPFPDWIGYSEDLVWAHYILAAGHSLLYEPRAEALHAHHYSLRALFRRTYLVGRALRAYGIDGGATLPESVRFLSSELAYFLRQGHAFRLPQLLAYEFTRWAGFHTGRILGGKDERRRALERTGVLIDDTFASDPRRAS
ncbi:MAG TPA: glycosyltransferase family 2 protein [Longimicrobiales bacterium]